MRPGLLLALVLSAPGPPAAAATPGERFRDANEFVRTGDYPKGIALYSELAAEGTQSASLYWNWAQAARSRGATGEALWALLRGRELDPGDRAISREIERLREGSNLDPAEIAPEPLAAVARVSRRFRLDLVAVGLLFLSVVFHVFARVSGGARGAVLAAWILLALGLLAATPPLSASFARPTGVVVRRGAPLLDAASPMAEAAGALREGEVVPILERSGEYVRIEDSSGARGWALAADVRPLVAAPPAR